MTVRNTRPMLNAGNAGGDPTPFPSDHNSGGLRAAGWRQALSGFQRLLAQLPALPLLVILGMFGLTALLCIHEVRKWPYLGAQFSAQQDERSLILLSVSENGPAAKAGLAENDRVVAFGNPETLEKYETTGLEAVAGRHQLDSYEKVVQTGLAMSKAWSFMSQKSLVLYTASGKKVNLAPTRPRSLASLPFAVFAAMTQSFVVLMIAAGIFLFAPRSFSVVLLSLSGLGLSINMLTNSVLAARELVMSPLAIETVSVVNASASVLFIYCLLAMLWYFPSRINAFPFAPVILTVGFLILLIQHFHIFEFPIHAFQIPNLLPFPLAIGISLIQWRRTFNKPVERASMMWFMLSIYGVTSLVILFYSAPIMAGFPPIIGPHIATFALSFIYIGIALGTLKFRLFDMHAIWWKSIVWLLGGVIVFAADIILVAQFDLQQAQALPLALFLAGWAYFPLRQAIVAYFIGSKEVKLADHIPDMIKTFSRLNDFEEYEGRFVAFLQRVFAAADITRKPYDESANAILQESGLVLRVPKLAGPGVVALVGKANGRQLFSSNDARIADGFTRLVRNMMHARQREEAGKTEDRNQIVRDLHDDVGGKLLSLILKAPDKETVHCARQALAALKESLIVVENAQTVDTSSAFEKIIQDVTERMGEAGQRAKVQSRLDTNRVLTAREYVNLMRICQEVVSNWIKYAARGTEHLSLVVDTNGTIEIQASNEIGAPMLHAFSSERGLSNIRRRAEEIGASLMIDDNSSDARPNHFLLRVNVPIAD